MKYRFQRHGLHGLCPLCNLLVRTQIKNSMFIQAYLKWLCIIQRKVVTPMLNNQNQH